MKKRQHGLGYLPDHTNYELVAKPDAITLYIADHGKPVDIKDVSAAFPCCLPPKSRPRA